MRLTIIAGFVASFAVVASYTYYQSRRAKNEIERLLNTVNRLEAEKKQQAVEIQRKNAEANNAKTQQKHVQSAARISPTDVDEQLYQHGWFRDADHHHGLHGVPPAVSKQSGHGGDQASDTGSQSDLSGDL